MFRYDIGDLWNDSGRSDLSGPFWALSLRAFFDRCEHLRVVVPALSLPHAHNTAQGVFSFGFLGKRNATLAFVLYFCIFLFVRLIFVFGFRDVFWESRFRTGFWTGFLRGSFSYAFLDRFFKRLVFVRVLGQVFKEARFRARFRSGFLRGSFSRRFF